MAAGYPLDKGLGEPQGYSAAGAIRSIEKSLDHVENLTLNLVACSFSA
jgi:hypothetical protein